MTREPALLPERIFGLSAVDGRRAVRPGEVITFHFRARNSSEIATPPASLVLALPPGWSALGALEVPIPSVPPNGDHTEAFRIRPDVADATTAFSPVQVALHLEGLVLGSNVVTMRVFGKPRLNGPASSVRIDAAEEGALRTSVIVVNEGDAAATDVHVVAPPPPGFIADQNATSASCDDLAVGDTLSFAYVMRPVGPPAANVRINDAFASYDGGRVALVTGVGTLLVAHLAAPEIDAERRANRLDLAIRIANDGWVAARDVRCSVDLPAGWRVLRGTMRADGAPPAVRRDNEIENGVTLSLPLVPARGHVDLTLVASALRPRAEGDITVRCGTHVATCAIPDVEQRALRIDARPETAFAEPGSVVAIAIEAHNTGETVERLTVAVDGRTCWNGELRSGAAAHFEGSVAIPPSVGDGDALDVVLEAQADDGTQLARERFTLRAIDRPWLAVESVVWAGSKTRVTMRNVGATTARDVRIVGEATPLIAALAPGETYAFLVEPAIARSASIAGHDGRSVPIDWDDQAPPVVVAAEIIANATARRGKRFDVRVRLNAAAELQVLRLRPLAHPAALYVAGSSTINGHALVDGVDGSPLFGAEGLALHDIPARTPVELAWSLLPHTPGELIVAVEVAANGDPVALDALVVAIADAPLFGTRPNALPFHIDAATVGDVGAPASIGGDIGDIGEWETPPLEMTELTGIDAMPAAPDPSGPDVWALAKPDSIPSVVIETPSIITSLIIDAGRAAAISRVLRGEAGAGLISHVPSLAVLFPNRIATGDPSFDAAFAALADAVRSVYERLYVKLRIPGYVVRPSDLEDDVTRRDLLQLFVRIRAAGDAPAGALAVGEVHARIDRARIAAASMVLADAPLGGPHTLAAIATLLPRYGSSGVAAAVGAYVRELNATFERACAQSADGFTSYLTHQRVPELDATRAAAVAVLDEHNELASS
jgi:hypothetical protein